MLYQLSHIRSASKISSALTDPLPRPADRSLVSGALVGWPQIYSQRQDSILERYFGVTDHGKILEIPLGLLYETLALFTGYRR
jgi:hypothetical protein